MELLNFVLSYVCIYHRVSKKLKIFDSKHATGKMFRFFQIQDLYLFEH